MAADAAEAEPGFLAVAMPMFMAAHMILKYGMHGWKWDCRHGGWLHHEIQILRLDRSRLTGRFSSRQ